MAEAKGGSKVWVEASEPRRELRDQTGVIASFRAVGLSRRSYRCERC